MKPQRAGRGLTARYSTVVGWLELALASAVLIGVVVYALNSVPVLFDMNWGKNEAVYELVYRVLLVVIGLELVRMLVTHELRSILELLAFVIARKMLKPELTATDIAVGVLAFAALVLAARFGFPPPSVEQPKPPDPIP